MFVLKSTYNKLKAQAKLLGDRNEDMKVKNRELFCENTRLKAEIDALKSEVERLGKNDKRDKRGRYAK
jgi:dynactin complex subunit